MTVPDSQQLLALLHLNDSAFPSGSFSHSYGLESLVQAGVVYDIASLQAFLTTRLFDSMACFELVFLREAVLAAQEADMVAIADLDERLSAMMTVYELREASVQVGRRFLRSALPLYGKWAAQHYDSAIREKRCSGHYVLAYAVLLGDLGVPIESALMTYTHSVIFGQASAAIKLMNLGQSQIQSLIASMQPRIQEAVSQSMQISLSQCQVFTPAFDIRAMQHEYLFRRLFIS